VLGYKIEKSIGENIPVDSCEIKVKKTITGAVTPTHSQLIEISNGYVTSTDERKFYGYLMEIKRDNAVIILKGFSKMYDAVRKIVAKDYDSGVDASAGVISDIFTDLINTYTADLTCDATTVDDSGTAFILTQFKCRYTDVMERCQRLQDVLDWLTWYNHDEDKVYFKPKNYTTNANTVFIGGANNNIYKFTPWREETIGFMCNELTVHGGRDLVQIQETFNGDGSTTQFTLSQIPESVLVTVDSNIETGGKAGSTSGSYDYTVDQQNKQINFESGSIPGSGTDNVVVDYTYALPVPVQYPDDASIATYGKFSRVITLPDVTTVDDAYNKAVNYVKAHNSPAKSIKVWMRSPQVKAINPTIGEKIYVNDSMNSITGYFLIKNHVERWPEDTLELHLGDKAWREGDLDGDIQLRLKRLEEEETRNEDVLNIAKVFEHDISVARTSVQVDYGNICDSFILGHSKNSLLGTSVKLDNFEGDVTTDWTSGEFTIAKDSGTKKTGSNSMKVTSASGQTGYVTSTQSFGDISTQTGVASGSPTKGTAGFHMYVTNDTDITAVTLRIGSGASDYTEVSGTTFESSQDWGDETFSLYDAGWSYVLFDLDNGSETGTPDWENCDYARIALTFSGATSVYIDRFTCSKSNYVPNVLGDGINNRTVVDVTY
jgi:hypothetical protein